MRETNHYQGCTFEQCHFCCCFISIQLNHLSSLKWNIPPMTSLLVQVLQFWFLLLCLLCFFSGKFTLFLFLFCFFLFPFRKYPYLPPKILFWFWTPFTTKISRVFFYILSHKMVGYWVLPPCRMTILQGLKRVFWGSRISPIWLGMWENAEYYDGIQDFTAFRDAGILPKFGHRMPPPPPCKDHHKRCENNNSYASTETMFSYIHPVEDIEKHSLGSLNLDRKD